MKKETVGARFKALREHKGLSQEKFAQEFGLTQQTYSLIEKDKRNPNFRIMKILSDNFNVNLNWLIGGHGNMFREPIENIEQYRKASAELKAMSEKLEDIVKLIK